MAPYRPPGRSNRSGRAQAGDDIFEGLPIKQWTQSTSRVSLAPPVTEAQPDQIQDKWALEPAMPRDYQLLQPWTQQLLRMVRSGKVGQKRKSSREAEAEDEGRDDDANADEVNALSNRSGLNDENRAFVAKKWRIVSDQSAVPDHLLWEYLAPRRKGLPSFYYGSNDGYAPIVPTRRTRVSKIVDAVTGEVAVYDVLAPEGQSIENEVVEGSELASRESATVAPGTSIEGIGIANDEGVLVMEVRSAAGIARQRNRPPPKKKGGPGRGKKRVTFINPDGSTYTTIVPNATKIVPQAGQIVKHVAKGEEAVRDISAEEAASIQKRAREAAGQNGDGEGDDDDDGDDDEGDEDDEDGEDGQNDGADDRDDGEDAEGDTTMHDQQPEPVQPSVQESNGQAESTPEVTMADAQPEPSAPQPVAILDGAQDIPQEEVVPVSAPDVAQVESSAPAYEALTPPPQETAGPDGTAQLDGLSAQVEPLVESTAAVDGLDADVPAMPEQTEEAPLAPLPSEAPLEPDDVAAPAEVVQPSILPGLGANATLESAVPADSTRVESTGDEK